MQVNDEINNNCKWSLQKKNELIYINPKVIKVINHKIIAKRY